MTNDRMTWEEGVQAPEAPVVARTAGFVLRLSLVALLGWFGVFKFTPTEAEQIRPLVSQSPLMSWLYGVLGAREVSGLIGVVEIAAALMILARPWSARVAAAGSLTACGIFLATLSFLITTPGAWATVDGLFVPSALGAFLVKDVALLGAALWSTGEAFAAARLGVGQGVAGDSRAA